MDVLEIESPPKRAGEEMSYMPLNEFIAATIKDLSPFLMDEAFIFFDVPIAIDASGKIVLRNNGGRVRFKVKILQDKTYEISSGL